MSASVIELDRSRAIRQVLSSFLNEQQTAQAMRLWEDKYAHQPNLSVQYFARECSAIAGVTSGSSQLVKNLVKELYTQLHTLDQIHIRPTTRRVA